MSAGVPSRSERDLTDEERRELEAAHEELREAVAAYERFLGRELKPGEPVPVFEADELRVAQERIEAAETHLWELRERLLGWSRPPWAPSATLVSDWFSEEDVVYDELAEDVKQ